MRNDALDNNKNPAVPPHIRAIHILGFNTSHPTIKNRNEDKRVKNGSP